VAKIWAICLDLGKIKILHPKNMRSPTAMIERTQHYISITISAILLKIYSNKLL